MNDQKYIRGDTLLDAIRRYQLKGFAMMAAILALGGLYVLYSEL